MKESILVIAKVAAAAVLMVSVSLLLPSCEEVDVHIDGHEEDAGESVHLNLEEVAKMMAAIPIANPQLQEVHDAVTSSSENGYDEEYMMRSLFSMPGAGVGDVPTRAGRKKEYEKPLRELIVDYLGSTLQTKSEGGMTADEVVAVLEASDIQIYWPFSQDWDKKKFPIITYDPEDGSEVNIGYRLSIMDDGSRHVEEVMVDEAMAREMPVWVINRNSDSGHTSLEMLRREDPNWGVGGGAIIIKPEGHSGADVKSGSSFKSVLLKNFKMKRHFDTWFAGASEFFVKIGTVEDFTASTEAELRLYNPQVTDFMVVVKRDQVGLTIPFNAILITEWTDQLKSCAFMITEDDGGTLTSWDCSAVVKIASKSYGFDISIPFNSRDDIVWRGQLTSRWIEANSNVIGHFGDVDLTFEIIEY